MLQFRLRLLLLAFARESYSEMKVGGLIFRTDPHGFPEFFLRFHELRLLSQQRAKIVVQVSLLRCEYCCFLKFGDCLVGFMLQTQCPAQCLMSLPLLRRQVHSRPKLNDRFI
jgi:hypothetical protein